MSQKKWVSEIFRFYDFLSFLGHLNNAWPPGPWSHAPFWVILGTLFAILGPSGHSGAFRVLLAISGYVGHFGLFWAILGHSGPSGPFWALWALLAILGLWAILGNIGYSGSFWPFWALWFLRAISGPLGILGPLDSFTSIQTLIQFLRETFRPPYNTLHHSDQMS